jgi:ribonuclease P protein 1
MKSVYRFQQASLQILPFASKPNISHRFPCRTFCTEEKDSEQTLSQPKNKDVTLTEDVINVLTGGDPELVKKLKLAEFEYEVSKQEGSKVPSALTLSHWEELLMLSSTSKRTKYLTHLFKIEMKKLNEKNLKEERRLKREAEWEAEREAKKLNPEIEQHIDYGLGKNTIFLKIYDITMDHYNNNRMTQASMFDLPIIYDQSYEQHMTQQELKNTAKQLALSFVANREHKNPFPMQFCNVNFNGAVMKHLLKHIPTLYNPEFPISISPKSYLDMFPREKLVYLTPHCRTEMTHFDHDSIYIIGSMVDRGESKPHSLAIAKRENLRMAKLPLDRYLHFAGGSGKSLTLNQMISILLELKTHGDWDRALQAVPRRKLVPYTQQDSPRMVLLT